MRTLRTLAVAFGLAVATLPFAAATPQAAVSIGISVNFAPPPLPVYTQPAIPGPGYLWVPGYWAWDGDVGDYYWVPGYWTRPPRVGLLWTPGYWGWNNGVYVFNEGYWGSRVGFYGGVAYGFGYTGSGYEGGYWRGSSFYYNRSVTNVSINITNVYNRPVVVAPANRVSFNGGAGGVVARPTAVQIAAARQRVAPTPVQAAHVRQAAGNQALRAKANHGTPPVTAVPAPVGHTDPNPAGHGAAAVGAAGVAAGAAAAHRTPGALPSARTPATPGPAGVARPAVQKPVTPGLARPAIQKPVTPGVARPAVQKPAAVRPAPAVTRPAVQKPVQAVRPAVQSRPVQARPAVQARPVQARPAVQARPVQPRPVQARPTAPQRRLPPQ